MDGIHNLFPADYDLLNQQRLLPKLTPKDCLTLVAPSGFGKTLFLKFITYTKSYRRRYKHLRNATICYLDSAQVSIYSQEPIAGSIIPSAQPAGILAQLILHSIREQLDPATANQLQSINTNPSEINLPELTQEIARLIKTNRNSLFICVDNVEYLLTPRLQPCLDYLRQIYDLGGGKMRYLFSLQDMRLTTDFSANNWGILSTIIAHQVVYMSLPLIKERLHPPFNNLISKLLHHLRTNTPQFREKLVQIQNLTGGYQPYARRFLDQAEVPRQVNLTPELNSASSRLLNTLTSGQLKILVAIAHGQSLNTSYDLELLIDMRILQRRGNGVTLFSPIMQKYLTTYPVS
jgi:hypothetical protein